MDLSYGIICRRKNKQEAPFPSHHSYVVRPNRMGALPEPEPTAYTFITCFLLRVGCALSQHGFDFSLRPASVKRGAMAIGKARRRAVDSPVISSRTGCELTVVLVLTILTIFFFLRCRARTPLYMGPPRHFGQRHQLPSHTRPSCMAQCTRSEILQVRRRWLWLG